MHAVSVTVPLARLVVIAKKIVRLPACRVFVYFSQQPAELRCGEFVDVSNLKIHRQLNLIIRAAVHLGELCDIWLIGLTDQHRISGILVHDLSHFAQHLMNFRQVVCVLVRDLRIAISVLPGQYRVVMQIGVFKQARDGINSKPGHAPVEPEAHGVVHRLPHLGIAPVQIGLFRVEVMVVILVGDWVECPCGMAKPRLPVVGRLVWPLPVSPDVPVALRVCARRTRFRKPGMLVRRVIGNKIHDHADVAFLRFADQPVEVRESAIKRIEGCVVGDVVTEIHQG